MYKGKLMCEIKGFPCYTVDFLGNVYGKRGKLKPYKENGGTYTVNLTKADGKRVKKTIASLVYSSFESPFGSEYVVVNKDGNKANNRADNLELKVRGYHAVYGKNGFQKNKRI